MISRGRTSAEKVSRVDLDVLGRLEQVLSDEIDALKNHELNQLAAFTSRKALCLLEMTRMQNIEVGAEARLSLMRRLEAVRRDIALNQRLIATHLRAANDVALLLSHALTSANADGTYSPGSVRMATP